MGVLAPQGGWAFFKRKAVDYARTHRLWRRKKHDGVSTYDVISACYNVAPYLGAYFHSLTEQTLDFQRHIRLIMVDDGSTDGTANIIEAWRQRYPKNIIYVQQENKGQAAARNAGLALATAAWVTFIDPDDFVDVTYFAHIDDFLRKQKADNRAITPVMLCCNIVPYVEKRKKFSDSHALRSKFLQSQRIVPVQAIGYDIQLSASSALFPLKELQKTNIRFNEAIRGVFEDAHFILSYLNENMNKSIAYLKMPLYYYRRRKESNSTIRAARDGSYFYSGNMTDAYLSIINASLQKFGHVPPHVQRTVCYDLLWRIKYGYMKPRLRALATGKEIHDYFALLGKVFSYIDPEIIFNFPPEIHKLRKGAISGILYHFKGLAPPLPTVHIQRYDRKSKRLCLYFFSSTPRVLGITINDQPVVRVKRADVSLPFAGIPFAIRTVIWIPVPEESGHTLTISLDDTLSAIECGDFHAVGPTPVQALLKALGV